MPERFTILLVDDSETDRDLVRRILARHWQWEGDDPAVQRQAFPADIITAYTEEEVLAALEPAPSIILADWVVPGGADALRVLALVREQKVDVPIIVLSGMLSTEDVMHCLRQGAKDLVLKTEIERLPVAIRQVLHEVGLRRELAEQQELYRILVETSPDAIVTIDTASTILFVNRAAERIFGYQQAEMLGQSLTMLMPEPLRPLHLAALQRYLASGVKQQEWRNLVLTGLHKRGDEVPVEVSFDEYRTDGNKRFTGIMRDITERLKFEQAQQRYTEELEIRLQTLEKSLQSFPELQEEGLAIIQEIKRLQRKDDG